MFMRSLLLSSVAVAVLASGPSANDLCDEIELNLGSNVEVIGTWDTRVYSDALVSCSIKDEVCKYKETRGSNGVELFVESLVWSHVEGSSCDRIESGKFRLEPTSARGQLAVVIAMALAIAAVLTVLFGCLAFYAHPESFWGRILRKERAQSPPESPVEMTNRQSVSITVARDGSAE